VGKGSSSSRDYDFLYENTYKIVKGTICSDKPVVVAERKQQKPRSSKNKCKAAC
jgi:hypothetical protein